VTDVVLAHQGGWDEALFVAVPMAVFAGLLWMAKRRAEREADAQEATAAGDDTPR
jgi:cyanate permease